MTNSTTVTNDDSQKLPEPPSDEKKEEPEPEPQPEPTAQTSQSAPVQQPADPNTMLVQDLMRQVAEMRQELAEAKATTPVVGDEDEDEDPEVKVRLWVLNEDDEPAKNSIIEQVYRQSEWDQLNSTMPGTKSTYLAHIGLHGKKIS